MFPRDANLEVGPVQPGVPNQGSDKSEFLPDDPQDKRDHAALEEGGGLAQCAAAGWG